MKIVRVDAREQHGTALIHADESVWISVSPAWWDIASWLWWWLAPSDKKAWITLRTKGGFVRSRAIRIARKHVCFGEIADESNNKT